MDKVNEITTTTKPDTLAEAISHEKLGDAGHQWAADNIISLQEVTKDIAHSSMYYPASGTDLLRPIAAYDLDELIAVDTEPLVPELFTEKLADLGVQFTQRIEADSKTTFITFELNGKQRSVQFINNDARDVHNSLDDHSIDILHIYLPTGADQDMDEFDTYLESQYGERWRPKKFELEESGELPAIPQNMNMGKKGLTNDISLPNYRLVKVGGAFVFNEQQLSRYDLSPALLSIAGLREKKCVRRYPLSVQTSLHDTKEEILKQDRTGYLYIKEHEAPDELVTVAAEEMENNFWRNYPILEFEQGNFEFMGVRDGISVTQGFTQEFNSMLNTLETGCEKLLKTGASSELVNKYKDEVVSSYQNSIAAMQIRCTDALNLYKSVRAKVHSGEISNAQGISELGLVQKNYRVISDKFPVIPSLVTGSDEEIEAAHKVLEEFSKLDLNGIFARDLRR